jgi:hypothetical protein
MERQATSSGTKRSHETLFVQTTLFNKATDAAIQLIGGQEKHLAKDLAKVSLDLVFCDKAGRLKIMSYGAVNALLNEVSQNDAALLPEPKLLKKQVRRARRRVCLARLRRRLPSSKPALTVGSLEWIAVFSSFRQSVFLRQSCAPGLLCAREFFG